MAKSGTLEKVALDDRQLGSLLQESAAGMFSQPTAF
jgi:hypothetical protein